MSDESSEPDLGQAYADKMFEERILTDEDTTAIEQLLGKQVAIFKRRKKEEE